MFWTNTQRIFKSGFVNFWRSGFISLASSLVMVTTLMVIGSLLFLGTLFDSTLTQIKNKVDINVYFVTDAQEEDILALKRSLEALPEVASIDYESREDVLAAFRERHADDQTMLQALDEIGDNPLRAVLNIRAKTPSQYETIAQFLKGDSGVAGSENVDIVDDVNYFQNKVAIDRLTKIIDSSERFGFILTLIFVIMSSLITFNTIRLAIYTSRDEISVMRLVGASGSYVRGPFVVTGVMYGLVSGVIALILFLPITYWLGPITENFFTGINIFTYYMSNFAEFFVLIIGAGVLLGAASSYLAVRRYLEV